MSIVKLLFVCLAAHVLEFPPMDSRICQTSDASPAEPGGLPLTLGNSADCSGHAEPEVSIIAGAAKVRCADRKARWRHWAASSRQPSAHASKQRAVRDKKFISWQQKRNQLSFARNLPIFDCCPGFVALEPYTDCANKIRYKTNQRQGYATATVGIVGDFRAASSPRISLSSDTCGALSPVLLR